VLAGSVVLTDSIETEIGRAAVVHTAAAIGAEPGPWVSVDELIDHEPLTASSVRRARLAVRREISRRASRA
jgi:hypothetical protein